MRTNRRLLIAAACLLSIVALAPPAGAGPEIRSDVQVPAGAGVKADIVPTTSPQVCRSLCERKRDQCEAQETAACGKSFEHCVRACEGPAPK